MLAVSTTLMPASMARSNRRLASSSLVLLPNSIEPSANGLTIRPVRPRGRLAMFMSIPTDSRCPEYEPVGRGGRVRALRQRGRPDIVPDVGATFDQERLEGLSPCRHHTAGSGSRS